MWLVGRLEITALFEGTLSHQAYLSYKQEYLRNTPEYQRFIQIGLELRQVHFGVICRV